MDRTEIKRTYKETGPPMGIYKITNRITDHVFLGRAKNLNAIINRHRFELEMKNHKIPELQEAWNRSGEQDIVFEIIDKLDPKTELGYDYSEDLLELEKLWIEKLTSEGMGIFRLKNTGLDV